MCRNRELLPGGDHQEEYHRKQSGDGSRRLCGGIYIVAPINDKGKTVIEQNIIRNNAAAAVGGIYLEGAAGKTERYAFTWSIT